MPPAPGYIRGPVVIPQTVEVKLLWQFANGKMGSNVLHAIVPDGTFPQAPDPDDIMNGIVASAGWGEINPLLSPDTRLMGIECKDLRQANVGGVPSTAPPAVGTSGSDAFPPGVALVVSLLTAQSGRPFRGRVYLGGWTVDAGTTGGAATDAAVTAATDFLLDVKAAMTAINYEMAIAHRGHAEYPSPATGLVVPAEAPGSVPVTQIRVTDAIFDSQRRRK